MFVSEILAVDIKKLDEGLEWNFIFKLMLIYSSKPPT